MQQVDDPPSLPVGTEVSAKYKGAFCEAKVSKVVRNIKVKVAYKQGLGSGIVSDDAIKSSPGQLRVGATVDVRHPDRKDSVEATVTKIQDCSQYTVVFDDGDITTLRRTALCLKSGRHFNESETLDQLPLTHPEHFGNPVVGGRRGRRRGQTNEDSTDDEDEADPKEVVNEKEENIGKVVCIETESKKKDKEKWFPGLVVAPTAQATVRIRVKDEYLVRSFRDGRYYTVPKKEATEFTREAAAKQDVPAVQAALEYLDSNVLPAHWDRDALFGLSNSSSEDDDEVESDSSDDEPREEKDHFVAQLYKYMDDRGTPLNKVPSIQSRDVDFYRLFRAVQKRGGYNRVTTQNQWKPIAMRLGFTPVTVSVANLVKQAYKKFLQPYGEFNRKLGCSMLMTPRNSNRSKGRSLVRASSVASPKPTEVKEKEASLGKSSLSASTSSTPTPVPQIITTTPTAVVQSAAEESENASECSVETTKNKRKTSIGNGKVKNIVDKYEEKNIKDEGDVPLSKIKAAVTASRNEEKEKEKEKEKDKEKDKEKEKEKDKEREKEKEKEKDIKETTTKESPTSNRDPSPSGSTASGKKEKLLRRQQLQNEEKRTKRKKDEISFEKVESGDFYVEIGDKLKVYYKEKKDKSTYEAKVIEIAMQQGIPMYLVHYTGWNTRYDEWVPRERIAENINKGYKQKARSTGNGNSTGPPDKCKENPPKPPSAASAPSNATSTNVTSTATKTPTGNKRGRGRSDSLPPRSTTPSSVASNSSRTKSPAASHVKRRPTRMKKNSTRRTSANVSDVSMPTESDTDSDEPVKRPSRILKEQSHKTSRNIGKSPIKAKSSISAANSQTESEDDDNEGPSVSLKKSDSNSSNMGSKGRDYDLNQIRSELKGFQGLKSPSLSSSEITDTKDLISIKSEGDCDNKTTTTVASNSVDSKNVKIEPKIECKTEAVKPSSTDISSETDSFADDDSQSSDKTTTLENMTKKFQQKINADKQRALEKQSPGKNVGKTRIVEKIIKDSLAEKRQESLKAKPHIKEDNKSKNEADVTKVLSEAGRKLAADVKNEEIKPSTSQAVETKPSLIAPARFGNTSSGKYNAPIVEKSLISSASKKNDNTNPKKIDTPKKGTDSQLKKFVEPSQKEIIKVEPPASCSPSSSSSSSSSFTSCVSNSSRSLPDMSKLDISGSSTATLFYSNVTKEHKFIPAMNKSITLDVYEFKDPEPFEFEARKSLISTNANLTITTVPPNSSLSGNLAASSRKQTQKQTQQDHSSAQSQISTLINRKKRGSPMKEPLAEKSKHLRMEEKAHMLAAKQSKIEEKQHLVATKQSKNEEKVNLVGKQSKIEEKPHSSAVAKQFKIEEKPHLSKQCKIEEKSLSAVAVKPKVEEKQPLVIATKPKIEESQVLVVAKQIKSEEKPASEATKQSETEDKPILVDVKQLKIEEKAALVVAKESKVEEKPVSTIAKQIKIGEKSTLTAEKQSKIEEKPTSVVPKQSKIEEDSVSTVAKHIKIEEKSATAAEDVELTQQTADITNTSLKGDTVKISLPQINVEASNTLAPNSSMLAPPVPSTSSHNVTHTPFDVLRKSPSFNLNINALNEELAQTVQETTRVLTDAIQPPTTPTTPSTPIAEIISIKVESSTSSNSNNLNNSKLASPKYGTPAKASTYTKTILGDLYTCEDTNTVFEETLCSPSTSHAEPKENKIELQNAKIVLSTEAGSFDLQPSNFENKPSIADKVLKAIHLKKIVGNKSKDIKEECDDEKVEELVDVKLTEFEKEKLDTINVSVVSNDSHKCTTPATELYMKEPLKIKIEASTTSSSPQNEKVLASPASSKNTSLISPDPCLKCAIQKKNILPAGTSVTDHFSDDSIDSTDSERRLVIEDIPEEPQNSPLTIQTIETSKDVSTTPHKSNESTNKIMFNIALPDLKVQTSTLLKDPTTSITSTNLASKLHTFSTKSTAEQLSTTAVAVHPTQNIHPITAIQLPTNYTSSGISETKIEEGLSSIKSTAQKLQTHQSSTVVPIILPDIPVSVVVASSAVPSVVAAAQAAAAAAAYQISKGNKQKQVPLYGANSMQATSLAVGPSASSTSFAANSASLKTFETAAAVRSVPIVKTMPASIAIPQTSSVYVPTGSISSSGFYLDARTELRPDDGLKPITDSISLEKSNNLVEIRADEYGASTSAGVGVDAHNEAINLLCEETIPGSPAPAFTGKEEMLQAPPQRSSSQTNETDIKNDYISNVDLPSTSNISNIPTGTNITLRPMTNSSPNDSASQDDSSEDLKKNMEVDEVSPRKRRRTRKQSEMITVIEQQQHKRRKQPTSCTKRNAAGSESDDNSDNISTRSANTRQQQQQQQQLQQQMQHAQMSSGTRPCPYNFLVQLDSSLSSDQCIAIILKQIQELRKTYNSVKGDLASIDRRRKKLRRREREKKQQLQNQQIKISS